MYFWRGVRIICGVKILFLKKKYELKEKFNEFDLVKICEVIKD